MHSPSPYQQLSHPAGRAQRSVWAVIRHCTRCRWGCSGSSAQGCHWMEKSPLFPHRSINWQWTELFVSSSVLFVFSPKYFPHAFSCSFFLTRRSLRAQCGLGSRVLKDTNTQQLERNTGFEGPTPILGIWPYLEDVLSLEQGLHLLLPELAAGFLQWCWIGTTLLPAKGKDQELVERRIPYNLCPLQLAKLKHNQVFNQVIVQSWALAETNQRDNLTLGDFTRLLSLSLLPASTKYFKLKGKIIWREKIPNEHL